MSKYNPEFKLTVVQECLKGGATVSFLSARHNIDQGTISSWCQRYKLHGIQAFAKKYTRYNAGFRLNALNYMVKNNLSRREAVAYFNIRGGTGVISHWQRLYDEGGLAALEPRPKGRPPKMTKKPIPIKTNKPLTAEQELEQLRKENAYLRAENDYLKKLDDLLQEKEQSQKTGTPPMKKRWW